VFICRQIKHEDFRHCKQKTTSVTIFFVILSLFPDGLSRAQVVHLLHERKSGDTLKLATRL